MEAQLIQRVSKQDRVRQLLAQRKSRSDIRNILNHEKYTGKNGAVITKYMVDRLCRSVTQAKVISHPAKKEEQNSFEVPHEVMRSILRSKSMTDEEKVLAMKICYRVK